MNECSVAFKGDDEYQIAQYCTSNRTQFLRNQIKENSEIEKKGKKKKKRMKLQLENSMKQWFAALLNRLKQKGNNSRETV